MSLQFILGSSGSGKSHYLSENIIQEAIANPKQQYLVLVPEQFTMQTQKQLVQMHPDSGIMNIDILSFQRLAYRVFEELGGYDEILLEETGKSLILQKIAQENKKKLKVLGGNLKKTGYISEMKSFISELMQYQVDTKQMEKLIEDSEEKMELHEKLKDVQCVYEGFCEYLQSRYITTEEVLEVLADALHKSKKIRNSVLAFDGFTGFTPVQNKVLRELLNCAEKVYVTVTIDPKEDIQKQASYYHLFSMSRQMIQKLSKMAMEERVEILPEIWIKPGEKSRFAQAPALAFLEEHLFRYGNQAYPKEQDEVGIFYARTPKEEMEIVAGKINKLVREDKLRYKDVAVITGDMSIYGEYTRQAFATANIPCFIDEKHSVLMNPFVECLRAVLDVVASDYSYASVFRYLRCGMTNLKRPQIDDLENYVIALGIRGYKHWNDTWTRHYRGMNPDQILYMNDIRLMVLDELGELTEILKRKDSTVLDNTRAIYEFVVRMQAQEKLKVQELLFAQAENRPMEKEYAQIYKVVMGLFDKMVSVLGEERVPLDDYKEILDAGLEETKIGIIPPSSDQVVFGDMERTRLKDIKVLFFVGVNEGIVPKTHSASQILSEMERDFLQKKSVELAPTAKENAYIQRFYLYLNMTKPSRRLELSCARLNSKGEALGEAYLLSNIRKLFPKLKIQEYREMDSDEWTLPAYLERPDSVFPALIEGLRLAVRGKVDNQWKELYSWYCAQPDYANRIGQVVEAAYYENPHDKIGKAAARALYGSQLHNSATRLEEYASCAFAHFLEYGLGLTERVRYEFQSADLGNIAHKALEWFSNKLKNSPYDWKNLEEEKRNEMIEESIEEVIHDYGNTILHSTSRNEYTIARVRRILKRTVWALQEQIRKGDFVPQSFEVNFSHVEDLETVNLVLSEQESMRLHGRIDRVDKLETNDCIYLKVIDYKTGNTSFDLVALYHGLQLQLMVYMNAAIEMEQKEHPDKEVEPAGVFYYQVKDPLVDQVEGEKPEDTNQRILQELKLNGILWENPDIIEHMDEKLASEKKSDILPVSYRKDGSLSALSSTVSQEQFHILSQYVNKKARNIGEAIVQGNVQVNPYIMKTKDACTYCPYKGVCGYDERIPGYEHRRLNSFQEDSIWEAFAKEVEPWQ
ncbi:MAG: helicase-exonuclease AddAB subunit AddB [Lachnospiraceae bacterium]|nr:helicase-exonuclease AddAB subunit AddB [Lachnospiraceae bacterium]MDD3615580.1 helicase-exonuclease AddAB subunit AddB [Lachnospiraceae bacterium]